MHTFSKLLLIWGKKRKKEKRGKIIGIPIVAPLGIMVSGGNRTFEKFCKLGWGKSLSSLRKQQLGWLVACKRPHTLTLNRISRIEDARSPLNRGPRRSTAFVNNGMREKQVGRTQRKGTRSDTYDRGGGSAVWYGPVRYETVLRG